MSNIFKDISDIKKMLQELTWAETDAKHEINEYKRKIAKLQTEYDRALKLYELDTATLNNEIRLLKEEIKKLKGNVEN